MTGKIFLYFITKLPRVEGGTSYVGFHGGEDEQSAPFLSISQGNIYNSIASHTTFTIPQCMSGKSYAVQSLKPAQFS